MWRLSAGSASNARGFARRAYSGTCPRRALRRGHPRREGLIGADGPLVCRTGEHTGRSPNDKFIVREPSSDEEIAWGGPNRPMDEARVRHAAPRPARVARTARRLRAGVLRRRGPALPPADPRHHASTPGTACSRGTCSSTAIRPTRTSARSRSSIRPASRPIPRVTAPTRKSSSRSTSRSASCSSPGRATPARSRSRSSAR